MMELGDKVFFIDTDGCTAIRKGTITCVKNLHGYIDFLSSRPKETYNIVKYEVCAIKKFDYQFFNPDVVFSSIESLKQYLAETEFNKYDLLE